MNNEFKPYGARINYLSKLFKSTMKEESLKQGINPTYANIVMILARHPEGLPQNDIAEKVLLAAPTVSLTLKQMETANYITRVTSPDDNRKTIVKLTADGYKFDEEIRACFRIVENKMIQNISQEELDYFSKILETMDENLHKEKETNDCA